MKILVRKLSCPVHYGDWHDKPLRWEVTDEKQANVQRFSTKAEAATFAHLWRTSDFLGAFNAYGALPLDYNFRRGYAAQRRAFK